MYMSGNSSHVHGNKREAWNAVLGFSFLDFNLPSNRRDYAFF